MKVVETKVSTTIPPPPEQLPAYTISTSQNGTPIYTTVVEEHNTYITNPTTIIRQGGGGSSGSSDGVSLDLFHKQVDRIYESMGDAADGLQESLAETFTTALLTVSGNASIGGDLDVVGTLTAGSLSVSGVSSGGAVEAPYFTATSTSQASTFPYASTTALTVSGGANALTIGSLTGFLKATAGAISTATIDLVSDVGSSILAVANGGTGAATFTNNRLLTGNGTSALVDEANLTFDGTLLTITGNATTTNLTTTGNLYLASNSDYVIHKNGTNFDFGAPASTGAFRFRSGLSGAVWVQIDNTTGNVGLGSTTPSAKLSVKGAGSSSGVNFQTTNSSDSPLFTILDSGNVGIGNSSPGVALSIGASSSGTLVDGVGSTFTPQVINARTSGVAGISVGVVDGTNNRRAGLFVDQTNGIWGLSNNYSSGNIPFVIRSASNERLRIDTSGNVGIGTTTPDQKLSVVKDVVSGNSGDTGQLALTGATNANKRLNLGYDTTGNYGFIEAAIVSANWSNLILQKTGGNVGIGTTTPWGLLSVNPNALGSGVPAFVVGSSTATSFVVTNGGLVGIGTASPTQGKLVVNEGNIFVADSSNTAYGIIFQRNGTQRGTITTGSGDLTLTSNSGATSGIRFDTNGASGAMMIMNTTGNVGIGTTSPWAKLSVAGTIAAPALVNDSTGYYVCLNTATGQMATSTTACGASSERFKENIEPLTYGLDAILALNPVSFDYKDSYIPDAPRQIGFIAEEVDGIIPELVARAGATIQGLDYPKFSAVIVNAIQELAETISGFAESFTTKRLCLEDVCITKNELLELLDESGQDSTPTPPAPEPETLDTETPSDEEPTADETITEPEPPTEETAPELEEESTPEPASEPAPETP